ncbi:hypothetical protein HK102_014022, partial [Quaeritorhiza haematococci]
MLTYKLATHPNDTWDLALDLPHNVGLAASPIIPFGPPSNPLLHVQLEAHFPRAPALEYFEDDMFVDMDATKALVWLLSAQFRPVDAALLEQDGTSLPMLSRILREVLDAWSEAAREAIQEEESTASVDRGLSRLTGGIGDETMAIEDGDIQSDYENSQQNQQSRGSHSPTSRRSSKLVGTVVRSAVISAVSGAEVPGGLQGQSRFGLVDAVDIDNTVEALFQTSSLDKVIEDEFGPLHPTSGPTGRKQSQPTLPRAKELIDQLRFPCTVPINSFVWHLCIRLMDAVSPQSSLRFPTSMRAFLRGLWLEIIRELRVHWECGSYVPGASGGLSPDDFDKAAQQQPVDTIDPTGAARKSADITSKINIDHRHTLLYQKLNMLNCCIHRRKKLISTTGTSPSKPTDSLDTRVSPLGSSTATMRPQVTSNLTRSLSDKSVTDKPYHRPQQSQKPFSSLVETIPEVPASTTTSDQSRFPSTSVPDPHRSAVTNIPHSQPEDYNIQPRPRPSVTSLSQRLFSSLTDLASAAAEAAVTTVGAVVANEDVNTGSMGGTGTSVAGKDDAYSSPLIKLFDRLTADETPTTVGFSSTSLLGREIAGADRRAYPSTSAAAAGLPPTAPGSSPQVLLGSSSSLPIGFAGRGGGRPWNEHEGMSWSSDKSWEDFNPVSTGSSGGAAGIGSGMPGGGNGMGSVLSIPAPRSSMNRQSSMSGSLLSNSLKSFESSVDGGDDPDVSSSSGNLTTEGVSKEGGDDEGNIRQKRSRKTVEEDDEDDDIFFDTIEDL